MRLLLCQLFFEFQKFCHLLQVCHKFRLCFGFEVVGLDVFQPFPLVLFFHFVLVLKYKNVKTRLFYSLCALVLLYHFFYEFATKCAPLLSWVVALVKIFCHFVVFCGDFVGDALACVCPISNSQPAPRNIKNVLVSSIRPRCIIYTVKRFQEVILATVNTQKPKLAGVFFCRLFCHFCNT